MHPSEEVLLAGFTLLTDLVRVQVEAGASQQCAHCEGAGCLTRRPKGREAAIGHTEMVHWLFIYAVARCCFAGEEPLG